MNLFDINEEDNSVALNKPWIMLIPEFRKLLDRDKGSDGDYRGSKKLQARREFTYIYFYCDFKSPIRDWEVNERHKESLYYANLTEVDDQVLLARAHYERLILKGTRSLRSYKAMLSVLDEMDTHLETLDFKLLNKRTGEPLNTPDSVANFLIKMDKVHTSVASFEKRVEEEMKSGSTGIRGSAELGDNEATDGGNNRKKEWSELEIQTESQRQKDQKAEVTTKGTFSEMADILRKQAKESSVSEEDIANDKDET